MMVYRHRLFRKHYQKRIIPHSTIDRKFQERLSLFLLNPKNPELNDHKLTGKKIGLRAFSITGDIRVVYRRLNGDIELFDIGTHNQVY